MPLGAQEALVYADPKRYFVPPYVGKRGWVGVRLDGRPGWRKVEQVIREAHTFISSPSPLRGEGRVRSAEVSGARVRGARTRPPAGTAAPRGRRR
jgi:hypothetical protein